MASNPGKFARTLKSMLTTALIVAVSVGVTLFFSSKASQVSSLLDVTLSEPKPLELPKPIFSSLEPFTVTLRTDRSTRILYVAITLRLDNETSRRLVAEFMPEVRDRILRTLAEQNADHIQTPKGRSELVALLDEAIEQPYVPQPIGPSVNSVLFTAFVIQ
ncbi:flagellar basal body-associated FliL family protein [Pollutimonas harenae]|uniref:Flagellar protein FliL n=1 Tax=Pollutimonas harenae TaxID=657015 RepID=A0A853GVA3_9BURK|nr:flagellar basal body-associated FliL family protein [Pollutimonas harenae]NYT86241.1 flagellar basal body-associated FliL family protein [Pollutimonas harenae]TEA71271.1 flagellar protein FliL [Pollutimonas harenae]